MIYKIMFYGGLAGAIIMFVIMVYTIVTENSLALIADLIGINRNKGKSRIRKNKIDIRRLIPKRKMGEVVNNEEEELTEFIDESEDTVLLNGESEDTVLLNEDETTILMDQEILEDEETSILVEEDKDKKFTTEIDIMVVNSDILL